VIRITSTVSECNTSGRLCGIAQEIKLKRLAFQPPVHPQLNGWDCRNNGVTPEV
jgi:hypothetical protein